MTCALMTCAQTALNQEPNVSVNKSELRFSATQTDVEDLESLKIGSYNIQ
jgi:hypothetical protein